MMCSKIITLSAIVWFGFSANTINNYVLERGIDTEGACLG